MPMPMVETHVQACLIFCLSFCLHVRDVIVTMTSADYALPERSPAAMLAACQ